MGVLDDILKEISAKKDSFDFEGSLRDLFGLEKPAQPDPVELTDKRTTEILQTLKQLTTDDTDQEIVLRALSNYLAIVKHVKAGGTVRFSSSEKILKVRLR